MFQDKIKPEALSENRKKPLSVYTCTVILLFFGISQLRLFIQERIGSGIGKNPGEVVERIRGLSVKLSKLSKHTFFRIICQSREDS